MCFSKYPLLICLNKMKVQNAIFLLGIRYMLLANKNKTK